MELQRNKIGFITVIGILLLALAVLGGCASTDSPAESETNSNDTVIQYDGKLIEYMDLDLFVPPSWSEKKQESSVSLNNEEGTITVTLVKSPIEGAPDHPLIVAGSSKTVLTSFLEGNGIQGDPVLEYKSINGYPCYYSTHNLWKDQPTNMDVKIYSNVYVVGFGDYCVIAVVLYQEQEQEMAEAVSSTLTTEEIAPETLASVSDWISVEQDPIGMYNYEQRVIAEAKARAEAEIDRQKTLEPAIGMTQREVRNSKWGSPDDINTTITKYGTHEQWVYSGGRYVYFDDGIVSSIQK